MSPGDLPLDARLERIEAQLARQDAKLDRIERQLDRWWGGLALLAAVAGAVGAAALSVVGNVVTAAIG